MTSAKTIQEILEELHKMKINGIEYEVTPREQNLIETALNDCINIHILPNDGFEGLIASHNHYGRGYLFAAIYYNPKDGAWDLYSIDGPHDEKKVGSFSNNFQAINALRKLQQEVWGDAYRKPVLEPSMGVFLREVT
jgi:hypothetical protein